MHPICRAGLSRKHGRCHSSSADADSDEADLMPLSDDDIVNGLESSGLTQDHGSPSEDRRTVRRKRCSLCLILRVFLVSVLFIFSLSIGLIFLYTHMTTCSSLECTTSSARLLANMDVAIDPCEDFYQYSCGSWINQSVSFNHNQWNMLYKTTQAAQDRVIKAMLDASMNRFPFELNLGEQAAVKVFRQCTNTEALPDIGVRPVMDLIQSLGGWMPDLEPKLVAVLDEFPDQDPVLLVAEETSEEKAVREKREILNSPLEDELLNAFNLSVFPLFFAGVQVSYINSSEHIITMYQQVPLLMEKKYYKTAIPTVEQIVEQKVASQNYIIWMQRQAGLDLADILGLKSPEVPRRIAEMMVLEYKITNCWPEETEWENDLYEVVTIEWLHEMAPMFDWQYIFSKVTGISLSRMEPVALRDGQLWMKQLALILGEYTSSVEKQIILRSYIKWKILAFYITYTKEQCGHDTLWLLSQLLLGPPHLRKVFCTMRLSGIFPLSLPSILRKADGYEKIMKTKKYAEEVAEQVREQYGQVLKETDVVDEYTRRNVLDKLYNMSLKTSFPDKMEFIEEMEAEADRAGASLFESMVVGTVAVYRKSTSRLRKPVDQRDWLDSKPAMSSVPVHNYERNLVLMPLDTLYAPLADSEQVDSLNYGTLATILGHEMTHAFDGEGKQHGPLGNLGHRNWWSRTSKAKFIENEQCFVNHFLNMSGGVTADESINARYENMADAAGLSIAFQTWKKHGRDVWWSLPGLSLTPEQRFFVAYAQGWCALSDQQSRNVHLNERMRVLGALRNTAAFSKAFSCKPDTYMNPVNKCRVW